ncbi:MAG: ATP-binding cassette domain-containing protein, partial [Myxococcota bacterium]
MQMERSKNLLVPDAERWRAADGPIISLEGVTKSFGEVEVLKGLDLEIEVGKITVIIGASASGKSVLIKLMNGLMFADEGKVTLFGQDPKALKDRELDSLRKRVGTLFQNYALFDSMTVRENVAFPLIEHNAVHTKQAHDIADGLMTELGLPHALTMYPSSLSGGMKKRVALARSIVSNPELVLFDEPTTGLDPIMMEFVDDMIRTINDKYGLTSVIISHDMASTFRLADH